MRLSDAGIGASDCEAISDAALAQPINALSSLAYVLAGVVVIAWALRARRPIVPTVVYGSSVAAIGLGSVLFHGPQPSGSQVLHDLPILITALFIACHDATLVWPRLGKGWAMFVISSVLATALTIVGTALGAGATGAVVCAVLVLEFLVYRRRARPIDPRQQRRVYLAMAVAAGLGVAAWLLGRTGSPVCDPDTYLQLHGLWHLISAAVFGLWWWLALGSTRDDLQAR